MALQVWLPLNGKNENQGISGIAINDSPASWGNGPIGKCGVFTGQKISIPYDIDSEQLTITFWFYPDTPDAWCDVFSIGAGDNRFEVSKTTRYYWYADKTPLISSGSVLGEFSNNKWYHIGFVITGEQCLLYINGTLQNKYTQTNQLSTVLSGNRKIMLMSRIAGNNTYNGSIADFRIYDNALSPKEVHEIAQGLCCHYPLNDPYATGSINKYSGDNFEGKPSSNNDNFIITKLPNERGYNYKFSYTGTGSDFWASIGFPVVSFTAGKKYDFSCKARANSGNTGFGMRASRMGNDWEAPAKNIMNCDGKWHEYHTQITLQAKSTRNGTEYDTKPLVEFYTGSMKTKDAVYTMNFDLKDIQICECSTAASGSNGSWADNTVYDTSGMGNHLTASGSTICEGNSPKYTHCINFNQSGYFKKTDLNINAQTFTIAYWVKIPSTISAQHFLFGTFNSWTENGVGAWRNASSDTGYNCIVRSSAESAYKSFSKFSMSYNVWTFVAYVYTGTEIKTYKNGACVSTTAYGKNGNCYMPNLYLGNSAFNSCPASETDEASMSDFRIYATALSDADIAELYNTPVSITSDGAMMTKGELIET